MKKSETSDQPPNGFWVSHALQDSAAERYHINQDSSLVASSEED